MFIRQLLLLFIFPIIIKSCTVDIAIAVCGIAIFHNNLQNNKQRD